ncbi:TlpA family protein disulfide reductase [Phocaeicola sp.]
MKKIILIALVCMGALAAQAQNEFTIRGKVKGLKEGTIVTLFRMDGNTGRSIANDTVKHETFSFRDKTAENSLEKLSLGCRGEGFPSMGLDIWVAPGTEVRIKGDNNYLYTWNVKSPIEQQKVRAGFIEGSRKLWDEYQRIGVEDYALAMKLYGGNANEDEKKHLRAQRDSLRKMEDALHIKITANEIEHLKQTPVTEVWMEKLEGVARTSAYQKDFPYKQEAITLYEGLTEELKNTEAGKNIHTSLFPPVVVNEGDEMADADLFDLDGKVHRLADYKGKYMLVDIWSAGCGPCIMALPEMKEIAEQYKDRLTIISLSTDRKKTWERASKEHDITWENLNDLQGTNGLYAKYGVNGIPNYILISPEGKVIKKWSGYGKGFLKLSMRRWVDTADHAMSMVASGTTTIVNYPTVRSCNTDVHEIKQVECSDTATIVRVHGYYIPEYWIQVSSSIALIAEDGTVCPLKRAEGITLDKHFFMPKSGEADYTFVFDPLPQGTKSFDMIERNAEKPDKLEGISLSMPHTYFITGKIEGIADGTPIGLWVDKGNMYARLVNMPLTDGMFSFRGSCTDGTYPTEVLVKGENRGFPNTSISVWVEPDAQISIKGNSKLYTNWQVESNVKEQKLEERFRTAIRKWEEQVQKLAIKTSLLFKDMEENSRTEKEEKEIWKKVEKIYAEQDVLRAKQAPELIKIMQETTVGPAWIKRLNELSYLYKFNKEFRQKEETVALCKCLSEKDKESELVKNLMIRIFPPAVVKEGDDMADADLYDVEGKVHHLSDFKGKYILLDFWSQGCGPCLKSLPEMKEVTEQYKDCLNVVCITSDSKDSWKTFSAARQLQDNNFNDLQGSHGLYARYGVQGIPHYVFISPEGKIVTTWMGYGEGSLKAKMKELLGK